MTTKLPWDQLYEILETTAIAWVNSIIARPGSHQPDYARLYEITAPHFQISFAPRSWADQSLTLLETYDVDGYCELVQRKYVTSTGLDSTYKKNVPMRGKETRSTNDGLWAM